MKKHMHNIFLTATSYLPLCGTGNFKPIEGKPYTARTATCLGCLCSAWRTESKRVRKLHEELRIADELVRTAGVRIADLRLAAKNKRKPK